MPEGRAHSEVPVLRTRDRIAGKDRLTETWETARTTVAPRLTAAREAVAPYVEQASARVAPYVEQAGARVAPYVEQAAEKVGPVLDEARQRVVPTVETARTRLVEEVIPTVTAAVESARVSSAPTRAIAKERAAAAALALAGKQPKQRRWPFAVAGLAAGALAGVAVSTLLRKQTPAQSAPVTPFPAATDDAPREEATQQQ
jgi:hypothetical protein